MTSRPAHRPSAREAMLAAAEAQMRATGSLSLESAAKAADVTKAGLMYHFGTKEELMYAVLDRVMDRYESRLVSYLRRVSSATDLASASPQQRLAAYVVWVCDAELDRSDLVMFADPRLSEALTRRWVDRLEPWLSVPDDVAPGDASRLLAARLMADGVWFAGASGSLELPTAHRQAVRDVALDLIGLTP